MQMVQIKFVSMQQNIKFVQLITHVSSQRQFSFGHWATIHLKHCWM